VLRFELTLAVAAALAIVGACSSSPTSQAWTRVDPSSIEQPPGFEDVHHNYQGSLQNTCAPCHPAVDTTMTGVTGGPAGVVAVGWIFQGFHGVAWRSSTGAVWRLGAPLGERTVLSGVAADRDRYVAVGLDGQGATAWTSSDGATWDQLLSPAFSGEPLRATAIVHWSRGFAVAGYTGAEVGAASPAFWRSADGLTWQRAAVPADPFGGRPVAIAAGGPGLVAVGSGSSDANGPAAIWVSPDGAAWERVAASPVLADVRLRAVASVPDLGLVAVGEDRSGSVGAILLSSDGRTWRRAPTAGSIGEPGTQVRLDAVTPGGPGVVVLGTADEGVQYGEAAVWTSTDGATWTRTAGGAAFADAELTAVAPFDGDLIAVGDRGAPDTYIATVWTSPPGWRR
jgi:hypothetical protein